MQQVFRKIKRVQPLIKLKQVKLEEETARLQALRQEKLAIVRAMKESQKRYMDGVEELNKVRADPKRTNLSTLEEGLDAVKAQWYRLYRSVQEAEQKERDQVAQVLQAERELRSVEKLQEKYQLEFQKQTQKSEQKALDEATIRRHASRH